MKMHLADHVEVLPQCRLWLAYFEGDSEGSIAATAQDIAEAKLSTQDLYRWQQFRPAAKKRQFLNSRLAIRAVLKREFGNDAENITYDSDAFGCPILRSREKLAHVPHISLSHSENAVAVGISDAEYPVGVDIKVSNPLRTDALRFVALHPHEQAWCDLHAGRKSEALTTLWTIKEAVWKTLREMQDIPFSDISVLFDCGKPRPAISNCHGEAPQFRTQVFVQNTKAIVPDSLCLSNSFVALRDCVAQRGQFSNEFLLRAWPNHEGSSRIKSQDAMQGS